MSSSTDNAQDQDCQGKETETVFWIVSYFNQPDNPVVLHEPSPQAGLIDPAEKVIVPTINVIPCATAIIQVNAPIGHIFDQEKPIRWKDDKEPPNLKIELVSGTQLRIDETNSSPPKEGKDRFDFFPNFLKVTREGECIPAAGGDPTIFNEGFGKPPDKPDDQSD